MRLDFGARTVVVTSVLFCAFSTSLVAQGCSALLSAGLYDHALSTVNHASYYARVNFARAITQKTQSEASSIGAQLGVPIDQIPVQLGYNNNSTGWTQFQSDVSSFDASTEAQQTSLLSAVSTINQGVVTAWTKCQMQKGLHWYVESSARPENFFVVFEFNTPSTVTNHVSAKLSWSPANVSCTISGAPYAVGAAITVGAAPVSLLCTRAYANGEFPPVVLTASATDGPLEGPIMNLPAWNEKAPPAPTAAAPAHGEIAVNVRCVAGVYSVFDGSNQPKGTAQITQTGIALAMVDQGGTRYLGGFYDKTAVFFQTPGGQAGQLLGDRIAWLQAQGWYWQRSSALSCQ